jgi:hypothetical protein
VFLQTTNSLGQVTSFAPLQITSTFTSTLSNGGVATFTEVIANPTLSANDRASNSTQYVSLGPYYIVRETEFLIAIGFSTTRAPLLVSF